MKRDVEDEKGETLTTIMMAIGLPCKEDGNNGNSTLYIYMTRPGGCEKKR